MMKIVVISLFSFINIASANTTLWPLPDWETSPKSNEIIKSHQCQKFINFATKSNQLKTDGLLVIKNGLIQYEFYDSKNNLNIAHPLWSISKTITATILGIATTDGRIALDQKLELFYPRPESSDAYKRISIKNLLYLDTGFIWDEAILDASLNPLIKMLYGQGHKDMAQFAASRNIIKEGPSYMWNYSTGGPTITMGILKKIYGDEYSTMPWRNLFNPLNMKNIIFERDLSGTFVGGSSVYASVRDLAKIGYLLLNNGVWNDEQILPQDWVKTMLTPSPGYLSEGTIINNITDDGVYAGSLWLNSALKKGFGKPYPYSPADMFLSIGYNGQLLIMLPSQNMIIVRTGHDKEYNSNVDKFVSLAISCFHNSNYKIGTKIKIPKHKMNFRQLILNVKNIIQAKTLQGSLAKIICSCHFVTGLDIPTCIKRNHFRYSELFTRMKVRKHYMKNNSYYVEVLLAKFARIFKLHFGSSAIATYDQKESNYGCTLK